MKEPDLPRHIDWMDAILTTLTELLKQPGEAGVVDGTGVHHPIGTNGISARALRSNNGSTGNRLGPVVSRDQFDSCG
ncbi:unnamed protein product [Pleuronectes platessa]|uniref:Uncharacterized protein n=1 Tax=Pleuronectes platessa TaxID=8262 RepID=A0A9N7TMC4_PLEPL|nr:unnamed protein product [Pleuronectes platessa]